jgi:uncharacterized protein DUF4123
MTPPPQAATARAEVAGLLFNSPDSGAFAVLDGASIRDLLKNLYALKPEFCCLYRGELEPDIATVAPYLARLDAGSPFTRWVLAEGWGEHWGIFLQSSADLRALRDHFRGFQNVELPDQRTVLFRYYDPRVLRTFLPVCNAAEAASFFGPVQSFVVEAETPQTGLKFSYVAETLKSESIQLKKPA